MEIQLQELIDKIKKEGLEAVQAEITKLKQDAEQEAKSIIESANQQAGKILTQAKDETARLEKTSLAAIEQAARNLLLSFQGEVQSLLNKIVKEAVNTTYSADVLKAVLPELLKNWAAKNTESLDILLSESQIKQLDDSFKALLSQTLKNGVDIRPMNNLDAGFHIVEKDGSAFYDFSAEAVANLLSSYLNPKLAGLLKAVEK